MNMSEIRVLLLTFHNNACNQDFGAQEIRISWLCLKSRFWGLVSMIMHEIRILGLTFHDYA